MHRGEDAMNPVNKHFFLHIAEIVEPKKNCKIETTERTLFGTDPDRNRVAWETPSSEAIPSVESH
jgi:hypothetical protein